MALLTAPEARSPQNAQPAGLGGAVSGDPTDLFCKLAGVRADKLLRSHQHALGLSLFRTLEMAWARAFEPSVKSFYL